MENSHESVRRAFEILAAGAPQVAESLLDVATNGKSEKARVDASVAVLDRIGLPAKVDVGITSTTLVGVVTAGDGETAVDVVRERLSILRGQAQAVTQGIAEAAVAGIIEGSVETEDDDA